MIPSSKQFAKPRRRVFPLRRGYSLAALFLLIATVAVLAAMANSLPAWSKIPWEVAAPNLLIGFLGGSLIGGTIGIHYERRVRSAFVGLSIGGLAGLIAAGLTVSNFNPFMTFMQCGILVALALLVRVTATHRPRLPPRPQAQAPPPRWVALSPRRRLAVALAACCTIAALISMILGTQAAGLASRRAWLDAASRLVLVLLSLGLTIYLLVSAKRSPASAEEPKRISPWD